MSRLEQVAPGFSTSPVKIVSIGGGHGLAATLAAWRSAGHFPIGVVSVADDGGSSGRLRAAFHRVPPGDMRRCLAALLPEDSSWADLLEYRFSQSELAGHALGNLIYTALEETRGDPVEAASCLGRLVGAQGCVMPASIEPLTLIGAGPQGDVLGQAKVASTVGIRSIRLVPEDPCVDEAVLSAIGQADLVTFGPGSLFTSVLAVCQIPSIRAALAASAAPKVLIANLAPGVGETEGLAIGHHLDLLLAQGVAIDTVLYDDTSIEVGCDTSAGSPMRWLRYALAREDGRIHDIGLLAKALADVIG